MRFSRSASLFLSISLIVVAMISCGRQEKEYRIGRDPTWYPLPLLGKEKNMVAFTNELVRAIAKEEGFHFVIVQQAFQSLYHNLDNGKLDAILSTVMPDLLPLGKYLHSEPFFRSGPVIITDHESEISSFADLQGKNVGVLYELTLIFDDEDFPSIRFIPFSNLNQALEQLEDNRVDALILPLVPAYIYTHRFYEKTLRIASPPLTQEGVRLVTLNTPNGRALIEEFDSGLKYLKNSSTFQELVDKWTVIDSIAPPNFEG